MQIIHHDVKPSNILVDSDGHCVLTDYGGSYITSTDDERAASWVKDTMPIFTVRYAAPEILLDGPVSTSYGPSADFWSFGMTLFELATGHVSLTFLYGNDPDLNFNLDRISLTKWTTTKLSLSSGKVGLIMTSLSSSLHIKASANSSLRSALPSF